MQEAININCSVSAERINENAARTAAFFTVIITVAGIWFDSYILIILLGADFAIRAFTKGKASPLRFLSRQTVQLLRIREKPTDAAPKKFAAGVGMIFCIAIVCMQLLTYFTTAAVVAGILLFCAILEGAGGICLGCIVYTFMVLPFTQKK